MLTSPLTSPSRDAAAKAGVDPDVQLVHRYPFADPPHLLSPDCWCHPQPTTAQPTLFIHHAVHTPDNPDPLPQPKT